jgi:hypothetical protein
MGVEDFMEAPVGVAVAATAALMSPRARQVMRRGAVYGLAGVLKAGDVAASAARGVASGVRETAAPPEEAAAERPHAARGGSHAAGRRAPRRTAQSRRSGPAKT